MIEEMARVGLVEAIEEAGADLEAWMWEPMNVTQLLIRFKAKDFPVFFPGEDIVCSEEDDLLVVYTVHDEGQVQAKIEYSQGLADYETAELFELIMIIGVVILERGE